MYINILIYIRAKCAFLKQEISIYGLYTNIEYAALLLCCDINKWNGSVPQCATVCFGVLRCVLVCFGAWAWRQGTRQQCNWLSKRPKAVCETHCVKSGMHSQSEAPWSRMKAEWKHRSTYVWTLNSVQHSNCYEISSIFYNAQHHVYYVADYCLQFVSLWVGECVSQVALAQQRGITSKNTYNTQSTCIVYRVVTLNSNSLSRLFHWLASTAWATKAYNRNTSDRIVELNWNWVALHCNVMHSLGYWLAWSACWADILVYRTQISIRACLS